MANPIPKFDSSKQMGNFIFESDDETIATIGVSGIKSVHVGTTNVKCTVPFEDGNHTAKCRVIVVESPIEMSMNPDEEIDISESMFGEHIEGITGQIMDSNPEIEIEDGKVTLPGGFLENEKTFHIRITGSTGLINGDILWLYLTVSPKLPDRTLQQGECVEYDVTYEDLSMDSWCEKLTKQNSWRLLSYKDNGNGTYSNVKLISTGSPAGIKVYCDENYASFKNCSWNVTDENLLDEYAKLHGYQSYKSIVGGKYAKYSWGAEFSAGLYYQLDKVPFKKATSSQSMNYGYFDKINNHGQNFDESSDWTASQLFGKEGNKVSILSFPEIEEIFGLEKGTIGSGYSGGDQFGILGTTGFHSYDNCPPILKKYDIKMGEWYWLASPIGSINPYSDEDDHFGFNASCMAFSGAQISGQGQDSKKSYDYNRIRPVITFENNIKFHLSEDGQYFTMEEIK